jgi:hypothetical protein
VTEQEIRRRLHSYLKCLLISEFRYVARRRLEKTENPSASARVNWKVCKSAIALC